MNTLAEISFEHIWLVCFGEIDGSDLDLAIRREEELFAELNNLTEDEIAALSMAAKGMKDYKDKYLTIEERRFLDDAISGKLFKKELSRLEVWKANKPL